MNPFTLLHRLEIIVVLQLRSTLRRLTSQSPYLTPLVSRPKFRIVKVTNKETKTRLKIGQIQGNKHGLMNRSKNG